MKVISVICLVSGISCAAISNGAERLRAHFDINVEDRGAHYQIRTAEDVAPRVPLTYDVRNAFGVYKLALLFAIDAATPDAYTLTVSLVDAKKGAGALDAAVIQESFRAALVTGAKGPSEFNVGKQDVSIKGAVALSRLP